MPAEEGCVQGETLNKLTGRTVPPRKSRPTSRMRKYGGQPNRIYGGRKYENGTDRKLRNGSRYSHTGVGGFALLHFLWGDPKGAEGSFTSQAGKKGERGLCAFPHRGGLRTTAAWWEVRKRWIQLITEREDVQNRSPKLVEFPLGNRSVEAGNYETWASGIPRLLLAKEGSSFGKEGVVRIQRDIRHASELG